MAQVVVIDSSEDVFVCGICKLVFNSLQLFLDHKRLQCTTKEAVDSANCVPRNVIEQQSHNSESPKVSASKTRLDNVSLTCSICNKKCKRINCFHTHMKSHEKRAQCSICGRCFNSNSHLKRHLTTHKVWPDGLTETTAKSSEVELLSYTCTYCDSVCSNYSQFRAHLNNHLALKKFKCVQDECNTFHEAVEDLLYHVSTYHKVVKYICHVCSLSFRSLDDIAIHHRSHSESRETLEINNKVTMKQYKCSQCDATFKKQERLSLHMLTETHNKPCIHCNRIFASDKRLRMHLQIHEKSKPYQCNICCSSFHVKKYLSSHMLKHGDSLFKCMVCKRTFKRLDVLRRHVKTHQLKKCFKCPFKDITDCMKEFNRQDKLKEHVKRHSKQIKSYLSKYKQLSSKDNDAGTVEICIVPLD